MTTKVICPPALKSVAKLLRDKKVADKKLLSKAQMEITKITQSGDIDHYDLVMHEIKRIVDGK